MKRHILLVDDNPGDRLLLIEALGDVDHDLVVHGMDSGTRAFAYLAKEGEPGSQPTPDLVVLDINMPVMNGLDALARIKGHDHWRSIPVAMLSSAHVQAEGDRAMRLGAAAFLLKPSEWSGYIGLAEMIHRCLGAASTSACLEEGEAKCDEDSGLLAAAEAT